jgi:hypothetical protein
VTDLPQPTSPSVAFQIVKVALAISAMRETGAQRRSCHDLALDNENAPNSRERTLCRITAEVWRDRRLQDRHGSERNSESCVLDQLRGFTPMNSRFLAVAQDPAIIPAVHHFCDEWCDYCPVAKRCLAFRCTAEFRKTKGRRDDEATFACMDEAVKFTRDLAAVEGTSTEELDDLISHPQGESAIQTSDALALLTWDYAEDVATALLPAPPPATNAGRRPASPDPEEVVAWYHVRIYMRVFRALVSRDRASAESNRNMEDAVGSAKVALVGVQRSRDALQSLRNIANERKIAELISMLDTIECGIDERFPAARSFVRVGLDVPVS